MLKSMDDGIPAWAGLVMHPLGGTVMAGRAALLSDLQWTLVVDPASPHAPTMISAAIYLGLVSKCRLMSCIGLLGRTAVERTFVQKFTDWTSAYEKRTWVIAMAQPREEEMPSPSARKTADSRFKVI
ncbi:hypothetical protein BH10PSE18_BH10PSE18_01910 [soil metagenome]